MLNLLQTEVTFFSQGLGNVPLTGITSLVATIINFFSFGASVGLGIVIFTLILKIIPLPLDIISRVSTKKNALKMEKMRPELEKLQKQYANNKELYNQKMLALYKKEGYSQFATCLPTIFTLVFFIMVISAFQQYSTYSKVNVFNKMAIAYDDCIKNELVVNDGYDADGYYKFAKDENDEIFIIARDENNDGVFSDNEYKFVLDDEQLFINEKLNKNSKYYQLVIKPAQDRAAETYFKESEKYSFLWVQNIWIEDLPWKKAFIEKGSYTQSFTYSEGCSTANIKTNQIKNSSSYDILMGSDKLDGVKEQSNGYLILVVLSIGVMLLSQFVMSKAQKAQLELQSVDGANGQAAQTSKMMMWIMPIMFGIFSFMYTASFSIYLIISTVFSMFSTMIINKIVEIKFNKNLKIKAEEEYNKRYGHLKK